MQNWCLHVNQTYSLSLILVIALKKYCVVHPCVVHPCVVHPCVVHPCVVHPCVVNPCVVHPCVVHPCFVYPCVVCLGQVFKASQALVAPPEDSPQDGDVQHVKTMTAAQLTRVQRHLQEHGLWGKQVPLKPDVDFQLPQLQGLLTYLAMKECKLFTYLLLSTILSLLWLGINTTYVSDLLWMFSWFLLLLYRWKYCRALSQHCFKASWAIQGNVTYCLILNYLHTEKSKS